MCKGLKGKALSHRDRVSKPAVARRLRQKSNIKTLKGVFRRMKGIKDGRRRQKIKACRSSERKETSVELPQTSAGEMVMLIRRQMRLSQEGLGELCGLSRTQVSRIECGKSIPRCGTIRKLERVLKVDLMERFISEELKEETEG